MPQTPLTADIERALLHALLRAWNECNDSHFWRRMVAPRIALSDSAARLGQWRPDERVIELARELVRTRPWGVVLEVLKHEMAHQFVAEVLGFVEESAHGPAFREVCKRLRIDGAAAGLPVAQDEREGAHTRILQRISKLLALAESQNRHEAEAAMAEAQRLMLKHNIESVGAGDYVFRHLGKPTGRTNEAERLLAGLIGEFFFVQVIYVRVWRVDEGQYGSVLEVCGAPVNVEMAEHVYGFLLRTAERLWDEYKRANGIRSNRDRQTFLAGVMTGFRDKLAAERKRHQKEGLVWVGDEDLRQYYRARHPYVQTVRRYGNQRTEAHGAGRAAGRNIVLNRPVSSGGGGRGRLLGS